MAKSSCEGFWNGLTLGALVGVAASVLYGPGSRVAAPGGATGALTGLLSGNAETHFERGQAELRARFEAAPREMAASDAAGSGLTPTPAAARPAATLKPAGAEAAGEAPPTDEPSPPAAV
jgi:hypothetical protein